MPTLINFFSEDIEFSLSNQQKIIKWIRSIVDKEKGNLSKLNFIFCSDKYLSEINSKYLKHSELTDIITFQYNDNSVAGDIFISIERLKENFKKYNSSFNDELLRVMIHGIFHMLGYKDSQIEEKELMRKKENEAIEIFVLLHK